MDIGEKVKFYLDRSDDTSYFLQKATGIRAKAIDSIRNGEAKPHNITLNTAFAVLNYFQGNSYEEDILHKLRDVLECDLSTYRLSRMMMYIGKDGHEHYPASNNIQKLREGKKDLYKIRIYSVLQLLNIYDELHPSRK